MSQAPTKLQICPLHTHTTGSVLDGCSSPQEFIDWCKQNGAPALGITDHGYMLFGLELYTKAKKAGITPLPGVEFYVAPDKDYKFSGKPFDYFHLTLLAFNEVGYRNLLKLASKSWDSDELPGFKKNKTSGLYEPVPAKRVVKKWGTQLKPRVTLAEVAEHAEGLIAGTGCLIGMVNKSLISGDGIGQAERNLLKLKDVFGDRLFAELMGHRCDHDFNRETKSFEKNPCSDFSPDGDLQTACNLRNLELAKKHHIKLLLTEDAHFVRPDQKKTQDVLLQNGDPQGWRFYNSYHQRRTDEIWGEYWEPTFGNDAESRKNFCEGIEHGHLIAEMAKGIKINDKFHQPEPEISKSIQELNVPRKDQLKMQILEEIEKHGRMKWDDPQYTERLNKELEVICDNGVEDFAPYHLWYAQWAEKAREHSILSGAGRGSGGGCLLFYLLKVTHINPLNPALALPFSRYLSKGRILRNKWPDYDWDVGARDLLVAMMHEKYGPKMAQSSTLQTLKTRSALKDSARVLLGWNSQDERIDSVAKSLSLEPQGVNSHDYIVGYTTPEGEAVEGELSKNPKLAAFFTEYPEVEKMVMSLLGIPKAISRHASAYLVSDERIDESCPTMDLDGSGFLVTQYNANVAFNAVEKSGLVKVDLLRINTLDDVAGAIRLVQKRMGYKVWEEKVKYDGQEFTIVRGELPIEQLPMPDGTILDIYELPEDPGVFKDIREGKTAACFQISSPAMTAFCVRVQPTSLEHMSAIVALDRPGPLDADTGITRLPEHRFPNSPATYSMAEAYIFRKAKELPVSYMHPDAEPILKDTFGVAVYQEQTQALLGLAGYDEEETDYMREALAKKKKQEVEKFLPELRKRLVDRGWTESQITAFLSLIDACAAYQFNRAHSAAYGLLALQCAFIKHYFPNEWWASVLSNSKVSDIREKNYAREVKDILELPHVNGPTDQFRLDAGKVHAPIYLIERVGNAASAAISRAREANGAFTGFQDFYERVEKTSVDSKVMWHLILCGAFRLIEPGKSVKDLYRLYCYFKRVQSLKIGKGKTGAALLKAVTDYQEVEKSSGKYLDLPEEMFWDNLQIELARTKLVPIWRVDVHQQFRQLLETYFIYGTDGYVSFRFHGANIPVLANTKQIAAACKIRSEFEGIFVGMVQEQTEFQYTDKKTKQRVTALKIQLVNDGDALECVLWPSLYQTFGLAKDDRLVMVKGKIRENNREPGKYSLSVQEIEHL